VIFVQFVSDFSCLFFGQLNNRTASFQPCGCSGMSVPNHPALGSHSYKIARQIRGLPSHFPFPSAPELRLSQSPRHEHRPPPATFQSLPATPWSHALIWGRLKYMPSGGVERSRCLAIGQDNRPIEALVPRHDATSENAPPTSHRREHVQCLEVSDQRCFLDRGSGDRNLPSLVIRTPE
jgi:hypothetical protein